jgi:hypothetical protein
MRTENWQSNTRGLRLVGEGESGSASTIFGPVKAGLTSTHKTQSQALSELLNSLEREVESLNSKYCEAYVTLTSALDLLVRLGDIIKEQGITSAIQD